MHTPAPLTRRQHETLAALNGFMTQHGCAPTIQQLSERLGVRSLSTVFKHLDALRRKGYITRRAGQSRASIPVVGGPVCPVCGRGFSGEGLDISSENSSVEAKGAV